MFYMSFKRLFTEYPMRPVSITFSPLLVGLNKTRFFEETGFFCDRRGKREEGRFIATAKAIRIVGAKQTGAIIYRFYSRFFTPFASPLPQIYVLTTLAVAISTKNG
jgi:hypothetical protein